MKFIYAKGTCALSVHILLEEMKASYQPIKVSLEDKTVLDHFNPKSYVPAIILDNGELMTEAVSILQFLSLEHDSAFLPTDAFKRAKCIEWLTYISTELHKGAGPLFSRDELSDDYLIDVTHKIGTRLQYLEDHLKDRAFIMDNDYTIADMYCLAILRILEHIKVDLKPYHSIEVYKKNLEDSAVIKQVLKDEVAAPLQDEIPEDDESVEITYMRQEYRSSGVERNH